MAGATTRAKKAGWQMAEGIIEMVHLMYQNNTALLFLAGLKERIQQEIMWRELPKKKNPPPV